MTTTAGTEEIKFAFQLQERELVLVNRNRDSWTFVLQFVQGGAPVSIGHFTLQRFPNCPKLLISLDTEIYLQFRGQGLSARLNDVKFQAAKILQARAMICTVANLNEPERHILQKLGWSKVAYLPPGKDISATEVWTIQIG